MSTDSELNWFKSSYSGSEGDDCVEVAHAPEAVYVRDSKGEDGAMLAFAPATWGRFLGMVGHRA